MRLRNLLPHLGATPKGFLIVITWRVWNKEPGTADLRLHTFERIIRYSKRSGYSCL